MFKQNICCYCNEKIDGFLNNPNDYSPDFYKRHKKDEVCCDKCYADIVVPRKMKHTIVPSIKM